MAQPVVLWLKIVDYFKSMRAKKNVIKQKYKGVSTGTNIHTISSTFLSKLNKTWRGFRL